MIIHAFSFHAPNIAKEPFDDLKLRQAMVYLVQKDFIVSRVLQGYGGSAHSVVTPAAGEWYSDDVNKFGDGMSKDERVAKATEILTASGYTVPDAKYPDGVLKLPDGTDMVPFEMLIPPGDYDQMGAMSGVLVQEWWREVGIPVTAIPTSFGEIVHKTFVPIPEELPEETTKPPDIEEPDSCLGTILLTGLLTAGAVVFCRKRT